jgi:hypothetical protein
MKYVCVALAGALLVIGWLYLGTNNELSDTKTKLAAAKAVNEENARAVARLERSIEITDGVLAGWNTDRTTLAGVRNATRQAIREAMRDETFKAWASAPAPADAWRLLNASTDAGGNGSAGTTGGTPGGLPGNADSGKRQ